MLYTCFQSQNKKVRVYKPQIVIYFKFNLLHDTNLPWHLQSFTPPPPPPHTHNTYPYEHILLHNEQNKYLLRKYKIHIFKNEYKICISELFLIYNKVQLYFKYNTIIVSLKLSHTTNLFNGLDIVNKFRMYILMKTMSLVNTYIKMNTE